MRKEEKAVRVLEHLEEMDGKTVINILNPYLDNDDLAYLYDKMEEDGVFGEKKNIKLIAIYFASDNCYEPLTNEYLNLDLDSFVERAKILYPEIIREDEIEETEGEIQNENEHYILTWEDGMDECVRIYQK